MVIQDKSLRYVIERGRRLKVWVMDDYASLRRQVKDEECLAAVHVDAQTSKVSVVIIQDMEQFVEQFRRLFVGESAGVEYYAVPRVDALVI